MLGIIPFRDGFDSPGFAGSLYCPGQFLSSQGPVIIGTSLCRNFPNGLAGFHPHDFSVKLREHRFDPFFESLNVLVLNPQHLGRRNGGNFPIIGTFFATDDYDLFCF